MENSTQHGTTTSELDELTISYLLYAAVAVEAVLMAVACWLIACMAAYGVKTNKFKKKPDEQFLSNRTMFLMCNVAVLLTIPRFAWSIAVIEVSRYNRSDEFCEVIMDITGVSYSTAVCPSYFFLWLRQRALYARPTIRELTGRWANALSWTLIVALTVGSLIMIVIIQAPKSYFAVSQGCAFSEDVGFHRNFFILASLLVGSQFSLLCLFIYPMLKTRQVRKNSESSIPIKFENNLHLKRGSAFSSRFPSRFSLLSGRKGKRPGVLQKTLRRTIIGTIVAVVSDVTTMAIANFILPSRLPIGIAVMIYDVSILVNVFCILVTFSSHRKILLVFCVGLNRAQEWETDTDHSDKSCKRASHPELATTASKDDAPCSRMTVMADIPRL